MGNYFENTKMGKGSKVVMVLLQSLAGSGHCVIKTRPKLADKLERILYDPFVGKRVLYKEKKKIRTL